LEFAVLPYPKVAILMLMMAFCLTSCRQRDAQPELKDPLFAELNTNAAAMKTKIEAQTKKITDIELELEKMPPRDPARKRRTKEVYDLKRGLVQMEQQATYFAVRAEQRKEYAKRAYDKAFDEGRDWPDPQEFAAYKEFQRLRHAPRNWEDRVPKTTRYNKQEPTPPPKEEGGGGGH
jgi:hypothetical protein